MWLEQFIRSTAWAMEKPPAYGAFHLTFTVVGLAICVLLAWLFRRLGKTGNRVLLTALGVFLMLTEVYKQLFYYYQIGNGSYQWWIFPFQLCSVPMYLCVVAPWLKAGRVQQGMYGFMTTFNLLGGLMAFIEPSGIVHEYWTLTLHAFIWHMTLVLIGFYLLASGRGAKTMQDYRAAVGTFVGLAAVAFIINLLLRDVSGGSVNMFFVGPSDSSLLVFKQISQTAGWYVSTLLYIPAVSLGAFLVFLPYHWYHRKKTTVR